MSLFFSFRSFYYFWGSVLAGFIIGIQRTRYSLCSYSLSSRFFSLSLSQLRTDRVFGHMIDCFDNFCMDKTLYHMISRYLSIKPYYKWRSMYFIETSPAFTSSQNKDVEVGTDKVAPPPPPPPPTQVEAGITIVFLIPNDSASLPCDGN